MSRGSLLDRLDARFAARLRRRPEAAFLLVAVVFAAASGARLLLLAPRPPAAGARPTAAAAGGDANATQPMPDDPAFAVLPGQTVVGPLPGQDQGAYVSARRGLVAARARAGPDEPVAAIVSFQRSLTPDRAAALVAGRQVRVAAARYRLPVQHAAPRRLAVDGQLRAGLARALVAEAQAARQEAQALEAMRASTDDPAFADTFARDRDHLLALASAAAAGGCACVYALEVRGPVRALASLAAAPGVRLVDPAPVGADPTAVTFRALSPG